MQELRSISNDFWNRMRGSVSRDSRSQIYRSQVDPRPRSFINIPLLVGVQGVSLTANPTDPWINGARIDSQGVIRQIHIVADAVTDTQFDLWIQRPGKTVLDAASIVNLQYPETIDPVTLDPIQEIILTPTGPPFPTAPLNPFAPDWTTIYIESGSLLYLYVLATDGACNEVTFNITLRAD